MSPIQFLVANRIRFTMPELPFQFGFDRPWVLYSLFVILPLLWWLSFQSLAGLGPVRRFTALLLRSAVVAMLIFALAEAKWQYKTDRLTVVYVVDQSESIPKTTREAMVKYVKRSVESQRRAEKNDRAGLIIFGADARVESAPFDGRLPIGEKFDSADYLDTTSTSLEAALKLAKASFPEDSARRVIVVSDGNENVGDARSVAKSMAEDGIGIDVVPIELVAQAEVSVDKVSMPSDLRKDQEFNTTVILSNHPDADGNAIPVTGELRIVRSDGKSETLVLPSSPDDPNKITLKPGKNVFGFQTKLDRSGVFTTRAEFIPDDRGVDLVEQNNVASAFTRVRGKGKVLLIEDAFEISEFDHLIERLAINAIEVDVMKNTELFTTAAELLEYDAVILGNLPRTSSNDVDVDVAVAGFSDSQVKMLVDNCEQMGCGIVMLGGDRSFGAGGWSNSLLEKAMPIDFQIKNKKVSAVGALAMVMHASEMPRGNFWQVKIGEAALETLGPMDYCGVVDWNHMGGGAGVRWIWKMPKGVDRVFGNKQKMLRQIRRMQPGDMPDFQPAMRLMLNGLLKTKASMRHAIMISDGDPTPPTAALLQKYKDNNIKISTVGVGTHGPAMRKELQAIADATGGRYWHVTDPRALPKIYQREARRVARPVIKESEAGLQAIPVTSNSTHEIVTGIDLASLPPFNGYVMSTIKKSGLVEQLAIASEPDDNGENSTLLAAWRYGNGRTIAFTSDAGKKWTSRWFNDDQYDKLFVQMIRYAMRPITETGEFTVSTELKDGVAKVVVSALDKDEKFLNFLQMSGTGIYSGGDDSSPVTLQFEQVRPGRYVAEHAVDGKGNLLYSIFPGEGYQKLTAGLSVPYSSEYSDRESNMRLLKDLAAMEPRGGQAGSFSKTSLTNDTVDQVLEQNSFRPTLTNSISIQDIWPFLLMCGTAVFFSDVFVRRVSLQWWAVGLALLATLPLSWAFYFSNKLMMARNSFGPPKSLWADEVSVPLFVASLIGGFAALFLAFLLTTEGVVNFFQRVKSYFVGDSGGEEEQSIARLRSRKAEVEKDIEARRAATKFEPDVPRGGSSKGTGAQQLEKIIGSEIEKTPALPPKIARENESDGESYTSRLLDAKRKLQRKRERNQDD
jgi:uncharacterized membrane protein/Mg-chelatase subunit ChlD